MTKIGGVAIPLFREDAPSEELYNLYDDALACRCLAHSFYGREEELCKLNILQCNHYLSEIYIRDREYYEQAKASIDDYYPMESWKFE